MYIPRQLHETPNILEDHETEIRNRNFRKTEEHKESKKEFKDING